MGLISCTKVRFTSDAGFQRIQNPRRVAEPTLQTARAPPGCTRSLSTSRVSDVPEASSKFARRRFQG
jgi:hypothetical protein